MAKCSTKHCNNGATSRVVIGGNVNTTKTRPVCNACRNVANTFPNMKVETKEQ